MGIQVHSSAGFNVPLMSFCNSSATVHIAHLEGVHYAWLTNPLRPALVQAITTTSTGANLVGSSDIDIATFLAKVSTKSSAGDASESPQVPVSNDDCPAAAATAAALVAGPASNPST